MKRRRRQREREALRREDEMEERFRKRFFPPDVPELRCDEDLETFGDAGLFVAMLVELVRARELATNFPIATVQPRPNENQLAWINRVHLALAPWRQGPARAVTLKRTGT